jgi:aminomethyltransferase
MKQTPLIDKHLALGARMAEFAGYNMPIAYRGIQEEHHAVRGDVGVFDVSHMGEFIIRGRQALDLIQLTTSNDAARLEIGQAQYTCLPNAQGGIIDDLLVYRLPEDQCAEGERAYMLVVNAANIEKDWKWLARNNRFDAKIIDISGQTGLLALQGPRAAEVLRPLTDINLSALKYYTFTKGTVAGISNVLVSATGYTGAGGFELYADAGAIAQLWDALFESGANLDIQPIGLGARDTLRLEMGYCLYGNDIDDTTSPLEAGLGWITKLDKGPFIGSDIFARQKAQGVGRRLVGFLVVDRRAPRQGYAIESLDGKLIGKVTSGTHSPSLDRPIGMGYMATEYSRPGTECLIDTGKKKLPAIVAKMPFYLGGAFPS